MPSLLTRTAVACSECNKPLSGGRDTFGTFECALCIDCRFLCEERGYLPSEKDQREKDSALLNKLREEESDLMEAIASAIRNDWKKELIDGLEDEFDVVGEEIQELEEFYELLPGEGILL